MTKKHSQHWLTIVHFSACVSHLLGSATATKRQRSENYYITVLTPFSLTVVYTLYYCSILKLFGLLAGNMNINVLTVSKAILY